MNRGAAPGPSTKPGRSSLWKLLILCVLLACGPAFPALAQLDEKNLDYDALIEAGLQRRGTVLNLSGKKIGDEGLKVLLSRKAQLKKVKKLDLRYNELSEAAGKLLAESDALPNLEELELKHNFLMDAGTVALAGAAGFPKLEELGLGWNEVRDAGAQAISQSRAFPKLKKLDFRGNFLADKTKQELKQKLPHLKSLKLEASL